MKKRLSLKESILVGSMLFGMFFGAGNLIFPVHMGQLAGTNVWPAIIGFIVTGVGLPLLGVACLGISKKDSLFELTSLVGDKYKYFFTMLLYLTIGPFFAIPRCAATSFTIGIQPLLNGADTLVPRLIFTFVFFALALIFALKPSNILKYIGKFINPIFLVFLIALIVVSFINPMLTVNNIVPDKSYMSAPFFQGFLEGYNTMDAIAGLAFGITVITVIRNLGISDETDVAMSTIKAGFFGCTLMAVIYAFTTYMGTMSRGVFETSSEGGTALSQISSHYFGQFGIYFLLVVVTLACFKTSLALIVSCSEMFYAMFPKFLSARVWAIIFTVFSFVISNFGLNAIITYAIPFLMFLYPLAISLIILALFGNLFNYDRKVFAITTIFTFIPALLDFFASFPEDGILPISFINGVKNISSRLPLSNIGLAWVVPAVIGLIVGLIVYIVEKEKNNNDIYKPISMWGYVGYEVLFAIPLIGFIFVLIFSLGGTKNINLENFSRSRLCFYIICFALIGIFCLFIGVVSILAIFNNLHI